MCALRKVSNPALVLVRGVFVWLGLSGAGSVGALTFEECGVAFASRVVSQCSISQGACSGMANCERLARCTPGNRRCESYLSGGTWTVNTPSPRYCAALGPVFVDDTQDAVVAQVCDRSLSDDERAARVRRFSSNLQAQDNADLALADFLLKVAEGFSRPPPQQRPNRPPPVKRDPGEGVQTMCSALAGRYRSQIDADMRAKMARGTQMTREWLESWQRLQGGSSRVCLCAGRRAAQMFSEEELAEARSRSQVWGQIPRARLEEVFGPCAQEGFGHRAEAEAYPWLIPPDRALRGGR